MDNLIREFEELLERERQAALNADVALLTDVQSAKQAFFDRIGDQDLSTSSEYEALVDRARANVALIRQLVTLLRILTGADNGTAAYGANGQTTLTPNHHFRRGVL